MKLKFVISLLLTLSVTLGHAQSANLKVNQIFDGRVVPKERMVLTRAKGRSLSKYGLTYYRSARFVATRWERDQCIAIVENDMANNRLGSSTKRSAKHTSITLMLKPKGTTNCFISFVCSKESNNQYNTIVIYMEGTVKTIAELKKRINN